MRVSLGLLGAVLAVFAPLNLAQAIVFYSQGNDYNLTNPGSEAKRTSFMSAVPIATAGDESKK